MKKSNVVSMYEYANNNDMYRDDKSLRYVEQVERTPIDLIIQNHLNNLRHTYGDDALRDVINLLGVMNDNKKKSA